MFFVEGCHHWWQRWPLCPKKRQPHRNFQEQIAYFLTREAAHLLVHRSLAAILLYYCRFTLWKDFCSLCFTLIIPGRRGKENETTGFPVSAASHISTCYVIMRCDMGTVGLPSRVCSLVRQQGHNVIPIAVPNWQNLFAQSRLRCFHGQASSLTIYFCKLILVPEERYGWPWNPQGWH